MSKYVFHIDGDKYSIFRDNYCWILTRIIYTKKGKQIGTETPTDYRYFTKFQHMAQYLLDKHLVLGNLEVFNNSIESISKQLESICKE